MACELGGVIGRSSRPTCFILGAGCSLSSGAPTTDLIHQALDDATKTRFEGLDLRRALHVIPEPEKQDILAPLFADVRPARGYLAMAALARHRLITVINLNWDDALTMACEQVGVPHATTDINRLTAKKQLPSLETGIINVHVHGIIGQECRYGVLETLTFSQIQTSWLLQNGLANTTVVIGASLHDETDFTVLFSEGAASTSSRPPASQWFFLRGAEADKPEDRLRQANVRLQAFTYVRDPDIDFDTAVILITDRAVGTIHGSSRKTKK